MKLLLSLCAIIAIAYASSVDLLVAKDLQTNPSEGDYSTYHHNGSYVIECCSASNPIYFFSAYNLSSLAGKTILSASVYVSVLSNRAPNQVSEVDNSKNPNVAFYNATNFSETPTQNINDFPNFDALITTLYLTNGSYYGIDVTSFIKNAVASQDEFFNLGWNPTGGYGAEVVIAARESNPNASFLRVEFESESASEEPMTMSPETSEPTTTCAPCPCGEVNLSGNNNASPARRFRRNSNQCPVCAACSTTAAPTTAAPTTSAPTTTTAAPVQLTPQPSTAAPTTTCPPCPCGEANLSGNNNASPARRLRSSNQCPTCAACPTTAVPTTAAPTTTSAPATTAAPVQLTPQPSTATPTTTCPPCPCGEVNLSGDNNASPARRLRRSTDQCPTCAACPTSAMPTTSAPTTTSPPVQLTQQPTQAPATCPPCPCGEVNLSGDNNASPARRLRSSNQCPTCAACPTTAMPTTSAPATTSPPVQLTQQPTQAPATCPPCPCGEVNLSGNNNASPARRLRRSTDQCPTCAACPTTTMPTTTSAPTTKAPSQNESGEDNSRESNSATQKTFLAGIIFSIVIALAL